MPGAMQTIGFNFELNAKSAMDTAFKFGNFMADLDKSMVKLGTDIKGKLKPITDRFVRNLLKKAKPFRTAWKKKIPKKLRAEIKQVGLSVSKLDRKWGGHLTSMKAKLAAFTAGTAGLGLLLKGFADLESQTVKLRREMPLTSAQMEKFSGVAGGLMKRGFSREAAFDPLTYAVRAKKSAGDIEALASAAANLSMRTGMGGQTTAELLDRLSSIYEYEGDVRGLASMFTYLDDTLFATTEQMGDFLQGMETQLRQVGPQMRETLLPQMAAFGGLLTDAWGDPNVAQQALGQLMDNMSVEGSRLQVQFQRVMPEVDWKQVMAEKDMEKVFMGMQALAADVGTMSQTQLEAIHGPISDLILNFQKIKRPQEEITAAFAGAAEMLGDMDYQQKRANDSMDKWSKAWNRLKNSLTGPIMEQGIALLEKFNGWLDKNVGTVSDFVSGVVEWIITNKDWIITGAKVLGTLFLIGKVLPLIAIGIKVIGVAWGVFNAFFLTTPIGWVVLGIVAAVGLLVGGLYLLWKHWDTIWGAIGASLKWVGGLLLDIGGWILKWLTPIGLVWRLFESFGIDVGNLLTSLWESVKWVGGVIWDMLVNPLSEGARYWIAFKDMVVGVIGSMWGGIKNLFTKSLNWFIDKINWVIGKVDWAIPGNLPTIPSLAEGGIIKGSPAGTLVRAGEGNRDEMIAPLRGGPQEGCQGIIDKLDWLGHYIVQHLAASPVSAPTGPRAGPAPLSARNEAALGMGG